MATNNSFADLMLDWKKVLDACPDAEWRLIFALSRYGGLRCPSEHLALKWSDVDWDAGKLRVPSPKTAHHEGKEFRFVPLFPELRKYLMEVYSAVPEGAVQGAATRVADEDHAAIATAVVTGGSDSDRPAVCER